MKNERHILKDFLREQIYHYRICNKLSQENMSEFLRVSTRSYSDQEHGKMGFSALSMLHFMLLLEEQELAELFQELRKHLDH